MLPWESRGPEDEPSDEGAKSACVRVRLKLSGTTVAKEELNLRNISNITSKEADVEHSRVRPAELAPTFARSSLGVHHVEGEGF